MGFSLGPRAVFTHGSLHVRISPENPCDFKQFREIVRGSGVPQPQQLQTKGCALQHALLFKQPPFVYKYTICPIRFLKLVLSSSRLSF